MPVDTFFPSGKHYENLTRTMPIMDHHSFRAQLVFSIGFALSRSRDLLRRLLREGTGDLGLQKILQVGLRPHQLLDAPTWRARWPPQAQVSDLTA
jgi:hypothetical protein